MDEIMALHYAGVPRAEIARRTGRTKSAVIGYIWRYKKNGPPRVAKPMPTLDEMKAAMAKHNGAIAPAARELGIHRLSMERRGLHGVKRTKRNRAKDPETRALISEINASGLSDRFIAEEIDTAPTVIYHWRRGTWSASPFLIQCVRTVLERQNSPGY